MYDFNEAYINACNGNLGRDIHEHLPTLDRLAKDCKHVTEMGVWDGTSSHAWLINDVELISYDFRYSKIADDLFVNAKKSNKSADYIIQDVRRLPTIAETDLLFIDTLHDYEQCKFELTTFSHMVKRYIVLHDTVTFGKVGETSPHGLLIAVAEFLLENTDWTVKEHHTNNNGLTVLEKKIPSIIG